MVHARMFSIDVISATRGASVNLFCSQQQCRGWNWKSFILDETAGVARPGVQDGLVMSVLHEVTGAVLLTKTFNTWHAYTHGLDLRWWVERVRAGRVVVMVVRGTGTYGIGDALPTLVALGSLLAPHAPPGALLVWVFVAGGHTKLETLIPRHRPLLYSNTTLHAHTLLLAAHNKSVFPHDLVPNSQERLCEAQAALGPLCDPLTPWVMPSPPDGAQQETKEVEEVGVVVCAGGRLQYLAHTLMLLFHNRDLTSDRVLVVIGGAPNPWVLALLGLLRLRHVVVDVSLSVSSIHHRLFQFYRGAWAAGLNTFPRARYLAFLDEDVEVSPDWLSVLHHLAPSLTLDPSLWCVTGSNSVVPSLRHDPSLMARGARQPGWGFLVLSQEARAVVQTWPGASNFSLLYDAFLHATVGRGRECVFPMLSRSRHYGVGVNTVPEIHHFYFLKDPLYDGHPATLPSPTALTREHYEAKVWARLRAALPISRNPCAPGFFRAPDIGPPTDLVFYFFMDHLENSLEWTLLAECVGAWPYSTQGLHLGTLEMPQAWGGSVWLVGDPASLYHTLRPTNVSVWRPTSHKQFEEQTQHFLSLRPLPNLTNMTKEAALTHLFLT